MKIDKMEKDELTYHVPVLLKESVDGMNIHPDGTYVDVTFGGAGHSREILSRLGEGGRLLGFDQDEDAERNIVNDPHFTFVRSNFRSPNLSETGQRLNRPPSGLKITTRRNRRNTTTMGR